VIKVRVSVTIDNGVALEMTANDVDITISRADMIPDSIRLAAEHIAASLETKERPS
jgi:hypothetical protein